MSLKPSADAATRFWAPPSGSTASANDANDNTAKLATNFIGFPSLLE